MDSFCVNEWAGPTRMDCFCVNEWVGTHSNGLLLYKRVGILPSQNYI